MNYPTLCLAIGALATAGIASSQASIAAPRDNAAEAGAKPKKPKRVCRERGRSGSHLSNVVCKTPEEWAQLQADFDDQDQYGIPGNRGKTARDMNVSPSNRIPF